MVVKAHDMAGSGPADGAVPGAGHDGSAITMASQLRLTVGDWVFLAALLSAMVGVILSARVAWREASLMESAKAQAQVLHRWAESVAQPVQGGGPMVSRSAQLCVKPLEPSVDSSPPVEPAASPDAADRAPTWGACKSQLGAPGGWLEAARNSFDPALPLMRVRCERGQYAGRGSLVVDKGVPSAPGFPPSVSWEPMPEDEILAKGLMIRISVCDAAGYALHVGEVRL